jgi:calcium/calmodulin-dependent protein kinase (CaM kinase) II
MNHDEQGLLKLNQRLLDAIAGGDWETYSGLCDPELTAYELEAPGQLVRGLAFHRFYFDLGGIRGRHQTTLAAPHVRVVGDVGVVCYARLIQCLGPDGAPVTRVSTETRVWKRDAASWKLIHFHRTAM